MTKVEFGHTSIQDKTGFASLQRLVNGYSEAMGETAKTPMPVYSVPGTIRFASGTTGLNGPCRGMAYVENKGLYVLGGSAVCLFDDIGVPTPCTGISIPGTDMATMAPNQNGTPQLAIVADGTYFMVNTGTNVVSKPAPANLPANPNGVAFLDGYLVFSFPNGQFWQTNINDALTVNALAFAVAQSLSSSLRTIANHRGALILLMQEGMELWEDAGTYPFAFARIRASIGIGCISAATVAEVDQTLMWVDHLGIVRQLTASEPVRVSNHTLERLIGELTYAEREALYATVTQFAGHAFYALTSPYWTWEFDFATNLWHERQSGGLQNWFARGWTLFNSKNIVGSSQDASIHLVSEAAQDESGNLFTFMAQSAPAHAYPNGLVFDELDVDIIPGQAIIGASADAANPQIILSWTDDGGKTWQGGRQASMGRVGQNMATAAFYQLGSSRRQGRTFRLSSSSPVVRGILLADARTRKIKV